MKYNRIFTIVLDSVGTGSAPDAAKFNDEGADTLNSVALAFEGNLEIPNLEKMGIGNLREKPLLGIDAQEEPLAYFGTMTEQSIGKDSIDGHWEMMGMLTPDVDTFPNGFPVDLIDKVKAHTNRGVVANKPMSGTTVIEEYGQHHVETGDLIVYTSGDSVFQIAAHEDIVPVEELYAICEYVRTLVNGPEYTLGRVIARPFIGNNKTGFIRTDRRHDYALQPTDKSTLNILSDNGFKTIGIGKISDLFAGQGIQLSYHNKDNMDGMDHLDEVMTQDFTGLCFVNLVDFDSKYGHRRDPIGFGKELELFDTRLGTVLEELKADDLLIITADHGNDPGFSGSDHTRELVPLLVYSPSFIGVGNLGRRHTFADVGATIAENFGLAGTGMGESFLKILE